MVNAALELVKVGKDTTGTVRKILKDLIQNVRTIVKSLLPQSDELDDSVNIETIKQKIITCKFNYNVYNNLFSKKIQRRCIIICIQNTSLLFLVLLKHLGW